MKFFMIVIAEELSTRQNKQHVIICLADAIDGKLKTNTSTETITARRFHIDCYRNE